MAHEHTATESDGHGHGGPKVWAAAGLVGAAAGFGLAMLLPAASAAHAVGDAAHALHVPMWLCVPFVALLLMIAVMPLAAGKFWHAHYPGVAFFLGALVLVYMCAAMGGPGRHEMLHAGVEYYSFIALVGGLYLVSGGVLIELRDRGTPLRNVGLLALGAVLANLLGTTGASVLLIRPFMRMNRGRFTAVHAVFFIFIVSNCGGCLTPIGDPPLYLGFLKGVPFFWTMKNLWPMWLMVNGALLAMFYLYDRRLPLVEGIVFDPQDRTPLIIGWPAVGCLLLIVAGVFVDPLLKKHAGVEGVPIGATLQIITAVVGYAITKPSIRHSNQFSFEPLKEVGFLFVGIFLTMAPALAYLRGHASSLGLESPTQFYFLTGGLSAVLDNAPTYVSFLQVALGVYQVPMTPEGICAFISTPATEVATANVDGRIMLEAISLGAVFFGAMTYIGNGPNFMVKSIVDAAYAAGHAPGAAPGQQTLGAKMPSFVGYAVLAALVLLPVLVLNWLVFIR